MKATITERTREVKTITLRLSSVSGYARRDVDISASELENFLRDSPRPYEKPKKVFPARTTSV